MLPWNGEDLCFDESRFSGKVRLFPLPDLVMFPHVVQPLHIFEQRYREMLREALDSDGLIAMSIPVPSSSPLIDEDRPDLEPYACLGKVVTHQRLEDGRYNLMLLGVRRVRLIEELPQERTFREAKVELLDDFESDISSASRDALQSQLTESFRTALPSGSLPSDAVSELLSSDIPLGVLTDLVSFALPFSGEIKRQLLGESNVDARANLLLQALGVKPSADSASEPLQAAAIKAAMGFPPPFSSN
ncbi:MAG: LON peptidase substrate-binding domain-containing protein [Lacipirellulaceae bacterium]